MEMKKLTCLVKACLPYGCSTEQPGRMTWVPKACFGPGLVNPVMLTKAKPEHP